MAGRLSKLLVAFAIISAVDGSANAAGFRLEFQSASTLADGGDAAVVEDAGTNWYNSAGLIRLPQQAVFSGMDVYVPIHFTGSTVAPSPFGDSFIGSGKASAYSNALSPALHYSYPISPCYAFGISLVPAWGLLDDYGRDSFVRYSVYQIKSKTLDISPSFSAKINDQWSIGVGPNFHYLSIMSKAAGRTQGPIAFGGTANDSFSQFNAANWGYGLHAGVLYQLNEATRVGLNYRTKIQMNLEGSSDFSVDESFAFRSNTFRLPIPLPPVTTLSVYSDINPCWAVMGTLALDQWSVLNNYHARDVMSLGFVAPDVVIPAHYRDTLEFAVGSHYKLTDSIMFRGSLKYSPAISRNSFRNVDFPDTEKLIVLIGGRYQYNPKIMVDFLYGHGFGKKMQINYANPLSLAQLTGRVSSSGDIIGGQLVWNI